MRVAVLSDTHAPRFWKRCPTRVADHLVAADVILHAGDVCTTGVLDELSAFAPVHAALGNNDGPEVSSWGAMNTVDLVLDGLSISMVHDSGPAKGRNARLRRQFPHARLIVFGHSHIPWNEQDEGVHLFNPGSPTDRRRQARGTIGLVEIHDGTLVSASIVPVTDER